MKGEQLYAMLVAAGHAWSRDRIADSWALSDRDERKRRLRAVRALCAELDRIEARTAFATAIAAGAIEAVIMGDWQEVASYADDLTWKDESGGEHWAREVYATFVTLLRAFAEEHRLARAGITPKS